MYKYSISEMSDTEQNKQEDNILNDLKNQLNSINKTLLDTYVITRESALNHITGQVFTVNSGERVIHDNEPGTDSNFFFKFATSFSPTASRIVVLQASIPKTYYLVNENSFTVVKGNLTFNVSLPQGNYNAISFRGELATRMTAASAEFGMGFLYSVMASSRLRSVETGLMTLRVQGNLVGNEYIQPQLIINDTLHEQLGFNPNSANTFVNNHLTSTHVCNFNLLSSLIIRSDICQNSQDNILQDIYAVSNVSNSFIVYENKAPNLYSKKLNHNGQTYHFWLTDVHGHIINLRGIEMCFTVLIY